MSKPFDEHTFKMEIPPWYVCTGDEVDGIQEAIVDGTSYFFYLANSIAGAIIFYVNGRFYTNESRMIIHPIHPPTHTEGDIYIVNAVTGEMTRATLTKTPSGDVIAVASANGNLSIIDAENVREGFIYVIPRVKGTLTKQTNTFVREGSVKAVATVNGEASNTNMVKQIEGDIKAIAAANCNVNKANITIPTEGAESTMSSLAGHLTEAITLITIGGGITAIGTDNAELSVDDDPVALAGDIMANAKANGKLVPASDTKLVEGNITATGIIEGEPNIKLIIWYDPVQTGSDILIRSAYSVTQTDDNILIQ